jgi:hypothetical protein
LLGDAFTNLTGGPGGSDGFVDSYLSLAVGEVAVRSSSDQDSFASKLGSAPLGPGYAVAIPIKRHGRITPVPVFGAAAGVPSANLSKQFNVAFPLKVTETGRIQRFTTADLPVKSQAFAVFVKNGSELVVNLGDHDTLVGSPINVTAQIPAAFNPGGLSGAQFSLVGFFDEDALPRKNLFFSDPGATRSRPTPLTEAQLGQAFDRANTFFLGTLASIPSVGGAAVIASTNANSFTARFGNNALGALPATISAELGSAPLDVIVSGAAGAPFEQAQIQTVTVNPTTGQISAVSVPVPNPAP